MAIQTARSPFLLTLWVVVALTSVACGEKPGAASTSATAKADVQTTSGDVQAQSDDADAGTAVTLDLGGIDVAADVDTTGACPGGPGCACSDNKGCDSGLCLDLPVGRQCARTCTDSCPGGFSCKAIGLGGGDPVNVCIAQFGLRCEPCAKSADCDSAGMSGAACVKYGFAGSFCGSPCATAIDCGAGYACSNVTTTEGTSAKQCVKLADVGTGLGACTCSPRAVGNGLGTPCGIEYGGGGGIAVVCKGQSACLSIGQYPTPCDAPKPASETCDNLDNDCDGKTDQGTCDDQNPCTLDLCSPGGLSSGKDGCEHPPTSAACDDGDPCTNGDLCGGGKCTPGTPICACKVDADCAKNEDGDACNGTLYCDKIALPHACKVNPATVVTCDLSGDTTCLTTSCAAATGVCDKAPAKNGTACEADGNKCTPDDSCQAGKCTAGTNLCDCKVTSDCASKEDGNPCNGTLFCHKSKGVCELNPATIVTCPSVDNTACAASACDPKTGACALKAKNADGACDDGNPCTTGDACDAGKCNPSANTCTCAVDADCGPKDDGDLCNGVLFCNKAKGVCQVNPATLVVCATVDDTTCTKNQCAPKTGKCAPKQVAGGCDDGNPCTVGDVCLAGACQPGTNTCACKADGDCAKSEDGNLCNGTLYCNKATGSCAVNPATVVVCNGTDDTFCLANQCDKGSGKCAVGFAHQGQSCDDGNLCTGDDHCKDGACVATVNACACKIAGDCAKFEDGDWCNGTMHCAGGGCVVNAATVVSCPADKNTPCAHNLCKASSGQCAMTAVNEGAACSDEEPCTVGDVCKAGACSAGGNVCPCLVDGDCGDGLACTADVCLKAKGCTHVGDDGKCEDGEVCTVGDCEAGKGCVQLAVQVSCSDGSACTAGDACDGGKCAGKVKVVCDDKNGCTDDACDLSKGCTFTANAAGCDDGDLCTVNDGCKAGKCSGGGILDCGDGNLCTTETCSSKGGCAYKVADCGDGNVCTADGCDKAKGCGNVGVTGVCDDGNSCTVGDVCNAVAAVCKAGKVQVPCDSGPCAKGKEEWWVTTVGNDSDPHKRCVVAESTDTSSAVVSECLGGGNCTFLSGKTASPVVKQDITLKGKASGVCTTKNGEIVLSAMSGGGIQRLAASGSLVWHTDTPVLVSVTAVVELVSGAILGAGFDETTSTAKWFIETIGGDGKGMKAISFGGVGPSGIDQIILHPTLGPVVIGREQASTINFAVNNGGILAIGVVEPKLVTTPKMSSFANLKVGDGRISAAVFGQSLVISTVNELSIVDESFGILLSVKPANGNFQILATAVSDNTILTMENVLDKSVALVRRTKSLVPYATQELGVAPAHLPNLGNQIVPHPDGSLLACVVTKAIGEASYPQVILRISPFLFNSCQSAGLCAALTPASCNDGNACTYDTCDPATGCVSLTVPNYCNDQNPCTTDTCAPKTGCAHAAVADSSPCTDNNACTSGDKCLAGKCAAPPTDCDDKNGCTTDSCDYASGCKNEAKTSGPCDDNNPCTFGDACTSGTCKPGQPLVDGSPCTGGKTCTSGKCGP